MRVLAKVVYNDILLTLSYFITHAKTLHNTYKEKIRNRLYLIPMKWSILNRF